MQGTGPEIALFTKTYAAYGGAEAMCRRFHLHLMENGVRSTVYCGRNRSDESGPDIVEIGLARPGRFAKALSFYMKAGRVLRGLPQGTRSMAFAPVAGCTVFRSGGAHLDFVAKTLRGYPTLAAKAWKTARRAANPVNWLQPLLDRAVYSDERTRTFLAISRLMAEEIIARFNLDPARVAVVPNGVDTAVFNPGAREAERLKARQALGLGDGVRVIGFCSTNFELKGLDPLIRAMAELPRDTALLVAGGRGPGRFADLAASLGLGDRVRFMGRVDHMQGWYAALDALAHPSFYDTFGNVVAEALAMGIPVAASPFAGAADLVRPGVSGTVTDPRDPKALARDLAACLALGPGSFAPDVPDDGEVFARYLELLLA